MTNPVQDVQRLGQSVWYDNIRRGMLRSGELQQLIDLGVTGLTSNPTIFEKAISGGTDYDDALLALAGQGKSILEIFEALAMEDIRAAADLLRPVYERTGGADGYASLEVNPHLAHDTDGTIAEARRLFAALDRPNVMVKVPATPQGIPAIRSLIGEGVNINVTLIFSLDAYRQVREAYISGLEQLARNGGDLGRVASVASFFVSRVDTAVDGLLEERIGQGNEELMGLLGQAANANAKLAYRAFQDTFDSDRVAALRQKGARVQRPLWASTSTKNPAYSDVLYVEPLVGPDTVNTMQQPTLEAFLDHGRAQVAVEQGVEEARRLMDSLAAAGISMEQVTGGLLADGVKAFADSFDGVLKNIEEKKAQLLARQRVHSGVTLGGYSSDVDGSVAGLARQDMVGRIWRKDHTVWRQDPAEITNRLGWLTVTEQMKEQVPALQAFAAEVREAGFKHVVLLGMGGSSLGPEVVRQTFGKVEGFPSLIVLDSTVPAQVQAVADEIDPPRTLFLVSSKSGGTTETLSFYRYFRSLVEQAIEKEEAGRNFVAITDQGTPLEKLAREEKFRRVFLNPADVGGRYSVLSYFGLVPMALTGVDIATLLGRGNEMKERCGPGAPAAENPGAWLGAMMGALARRGRDKLTLVTPPPTHSFGLWVEQMLAESLGKEGQGIIPVAGEPLMDPASYGPDRLFVYLGMQGGDNAATDAAVARIKEAGHPAVWLDLQDGYDLGSEFFRWKFATAVAGALIGIHPFDQPDVQGSKDNTDRVLEVYRRDGRLPPMAETGSLSQLLSQARPGDYFAAMAYIRQTPETDALLGDLRRWVLERHRLATTLGYGPRFLHSAGQLHKGGPATGLYLQLTADYPADLPIPGQPYSFGTLATAQAIGDFSALQGLGRRAVRVHLGADPIAGLRRLLDTPLLSPLGKGGL